MSSSTTSGQTPSGSHVFASYAHADAAAVEPEIARIEQFVPVWFDAEIRPGHRWNDELAAAIVGCSAFVLFVTPQSVRSEHCLRELQFAMAESRPVVAIHLEPTELPHGLRLALNDRQAILKHAMSDERYGQRLAQSFGSLASLGEPSGMHAAQRHVVSDRPSIAVLPFAVLGADAATESFAIGMTEDLTTLLSRVPAFFVVSRQSAANAAAGLADHAAIARALRVRYLVTGSVRSAGERLRVSAQLLDAGEGSTLWANTFDRPGADVFALQDELARRIAGQLRPELVIADLNYGRITRNYTSWRRIADAMVQYGHTPAPQHIDGLVRLVEETLQADPDYGPAHALYAFSLAHQRNWGDLTDAQTELCERAAKRALEIAPHDPLVLFFVAGVEQAMGRRRNGERLALQAADREPSNAAFQATAGFILTLGGKVEAGIERLSLAVDLSPSDPLRGQYLFQLASALFMARRFEEQADAVAESLRLQPDNTWAWLLRAAAAIHLRDDHEATAAIERIKALSGWDVTQFRTLLDRILADAWRRDPATRELWYQTLEALQRAGL